jgi:hypothetical protein
MGCRQTQTATNPNEPRDVAKGKNEKRVGSGFATPRGIRSSITGFTNMQHQEECHEP